MRGFLTDVPHSISLDVGRCFLLTVVNGGVWTIASSIGSCVAHHVWRIAQIIYLGTRQSITMGAPCAVPALCEKSAVFHHR